MVIPILGTDMETTLFSFGGSSILGFLAGFTLKRIVRIAAIVTLTIGWRINIISGAPTSTQSQEMTQGNVTTIYHDTILQIYHGNYKARYIECIYMEKGDMN
jgi:hypothetical protein